MKSYFTLKAGQQNHYTSLAMPSLAATNGMRSPQHMSMASPSGMRSPSHTSTFPPLPPVPPPPPDHQYSAGFPQGQELDSSDRAMLNMFLGESTRLAPSD